MSLGTAKDAKNILAGSRPAPIPWAYFLAVFHAMVLEDIGAERFRALAARAREACSERFPEMARDAAPDPDAGEPVA